MNFQPIKTLHCHGSVLSKCLTTVRVVGHTPKFSQKVQNLKWLCHCNTTWLLIVAIRKNANACRAAPSKVGMSTSGNVFPGIRNCNQDFLNKVPTNSSKHDNLLTLQNRFEVLQRIADNSVHCDLIDARECGATIAQTKLAHTNQKTQVKKSPKLLKNQANDIQIHEEVVTRLPSDYQCNSHPTTDSNDHSGRNLDNEIIVGNVKVEHHAPDAVSSVQTQPAIVDDCVKEEVVPLYIWANKHNSKDYVAEW